MDKSEITALSVAGFAVLAVVTIIVIDRGAGWRPESGEATRAYTTSTKTSRAELRDFTGISAGGIWQVDVVPGDEWQVDLIYPEDAADRLIVRVQNDRLMLAHRSDFWRFWDNWNSDDAAPTARIVMPALNALKVSGASKVQFDGFSGEQLDIRVSGAGKIDGANGRYTQLALRISGAGDADMSDIIFTDARTRLSGAGNVSLTMDGGVLSGRISGAAKIAYRGSASDVRITTSGAAAVRHVD